MQQFKVDTLRAALEYAAKGWYIFPLHSIDENGHCTCGSETCTDAGKHPRRELVPKGLKAASRDLSLIERWFHIEGEPSNIGIATGEISGITVIDIDIGDGKGGAESWQEIVTEHGEVQTLMASTGSGGVHMIFLYNSALKTASNVLGKGIDCRNDGGYIVAAPGRHRSGGVYSWVDESVEIRSLPAHMARRKETRGRPKKGDLTKAKYSLNTVQDMLSVVPADDRDTWRNVGIILGREFKRSDDAWLTYIEWAEKGMKDGKKGRNHDKIMHEAFYEISAIDTSSGSLTMGTIVKMALENGWAPKAGDVPIENFIYYGPGNNYIYRPTGSAWVSSAVDVAVSPVNEDGKILQASDWLKMNQLATSMTCDPSIEDDFVKGFDNRHGEICKVPGSAIYNNYIKPTIEPGDSRLAQPFLEHCAKVFNKKGDCEQFLNYMAHRVQKPWEKPRFALLIAGSQGVGKDTAIEMCGPAIGTWNIANIDPSAFESQFNEYAASTLVRISEAANLHEMSKWAFNERTKVLIAGTPDVMMINYKYGMKSPIRMYCGVVITTNHLGSGIYIPADDRRYDVIETASMEEMGIADIDIRRQYFDDLWSWFLLHGGDTHVAAYLANRDISGFSASNGQRKTDAHKTVVAAGMSSDEWLADILDDLQDVENAHGRGKLFAVRGDVITSKAEQKGEKAGDVKRKLGASLGRAGFQIYRNPDRQDGRWLIEGKRTTVYVKNDAPEGIIPNQIDALKEMF
jgi:hypothetical protein